MPLSLLASDNMEISQQLLAILTTLYVITSDVMQFLQSAPINPKSLHW